MFNILRAPFFVILLLCLSLVFGANTIEFALSEGKSHL